MLTDEQITELWHHFDEPQWSGWATSYQTLLERIDALGDDALVEPEHQKLLWSAAEICTLGPGENIDISGALIDPSVVGAVVALRRRVWPLRVDQRAAAIQDAFSHIMSLVHPRHAATRPNGRLQRLMVALLPAELHCVVNWSANRDIVEMILHPHKRASPLASQVMVRARLRQVLGDEAPGDFAEHVRRSLFCWWLHGQAEPLRKGYGALLGETQQTQGPKPLKVWSLARQSRHLEWPPNLTQSMRDVVRLSIQGAEQAELVEILGADASYAALSARTRRGLIRQARLLGLLEAAPGGLFPTVAGDALLEESLPDALVERFVERVVGAAWVLRWLEPIEALEREQLRRLLVGLCGSWRQSRVPEALMAWLTDMQVLTEVSPHNVALSLYGRQLARRLPETLPGPARDLNQLDLSQAQPEPLPRWPDFAEVRQSLNDGAPWLVVDPERLAALHAAWHCQPGKRFVILSGLSGTGKTALTLAYARSYCHRMGIDAQQHVVLVAVLPDWRDPSGLLGYFSALRAEPTFQAEPALQLILRAAEDPARPYFLILDEMNLARVERYMAPLLSAMETGQPISLHTHDAPVSGVPARVPWPENLFIAGTVNMDESTHAFSDKVLDRAFTLEFWEVDLARYFDQQREARPHGPRFEHIERFLCDLNAALRPARRHFGYRTAREVVLFVERAAELTGEPAQDQRMALDQAVMARVLPRVRGEDSPILRLALDNARVLCEDMGLVQSAERLEMLQDRLMSVGMTRFWA